MFSISGTYTDMYELAMAQVYFLKGYADERAVFDYFYRSIPFGGGYALFAGLEDLLQILEDLSFTTDDLDYLREQGFRREFVDHLGGFRFRGTIRSVCEGDPVFPLCPILSIEGSLLEAQLLETLVLNILNFETLIATKASRMRLAAGNRGLADFGLRRAQGPAGYLASRAAFAGGVDSTSNVLAGKDFGIPISGTMAHSLIQRYDSELDAFRDFAENRPDHCILLVDTYDTLHSGLPNAIRVAREMATRGQQLYGIRLDSGDLAYLSKQARHMLDQEGLPEVRIAVSNQLDEYVIESLLRQGAPIDLFGVGTRLVTGPPDASLDGVYKLAFANGKGRIKLSESTEKISLPGHKQVLRLRNADGTPAGADAIILADEPHADHMYHPSDPHKSMDIRNYTAAPLLQPVMRDGWRCLPSRSLSEIAAHARKCMDQLPAEFTRFTNPHLYKVGLSSRLRDLRDDLAAVQRKEVT